MGYSVVKFLKLLIQNLSVQLLLVVLSVYLWGDFLNEPLKAGFYSISLSLKAILLFVLPVIIFSCLFSCMLAFKDRAFTLILLLFAALSISNFASTFIAYFAGTQVLCLIQLQPQQVLESSQYPLFPLWNWMFPKLPNEYALILGFICGGISSFYRYPVVDIVANKLKQFVTFFLQKLFIPLLPLFACGFIIKMQHDRSLEQILQSYTSILAVIVIVYLLYLGVLYSVACGFRIGKGSYYIRNMIPASFMGFSTMSSMAALPLTLRAAELNTQNPLLARAVIPTTVNIHLIGDSIGIPIMAMAILLTFGYELPPLDQYFIFAVFFAVSKFAVAAVPGGGILVMIPILESYLGFNHEMSILITALYILFDPVITATNVAGNSVFAILFAKCFKKSPQFENSSVTVD
jgi:hypothetical protein